ncbi:MAG: hypothetical protein Q8T08_24030 [Ignavibacteria bacterium]|nr:hypothetical protein [Ignavibacteria bacterium]
MLRSLPLRSFLFTFLSSILLLSACNKFEGEQTVPAYLHVDTILLTTDYFTQGSNTHNFTDMWVYVNDQLIGAFELPATIPVLARGKNKLEIRPGIKLNGISGTRVPNPFYKPYTINDFTFIEDSVLTVYPTTSYYSTTNFAWTEDFENTSISLAKTSQSDTTINKTSPAHNPEAYLSNYSSYSGVVHLEGDVTNFQIASFLGYTLPGLGAPVVLEVDYKCDRAFGIGMFAKESGTIINIPLIVVNPSDTWKKIYINLGPNITEHNTASEFKVYFESELGTDAQARFLFDNIKLLYRNNLK